MIAPADVRNIDRQRTNQKAATGDQLDRSKARDKGELREWSDMVDKIGDPYLNYFALGLLVFVLIAIFYGIIAIHDIPARIAKARDHPHEDAIHAAGWVSLFTQMCCGRSFGFGRWPTNQSAVGAFRGQVPSHPSIRAKWTICAAA
jgi:hypothetical protein